MKKHVFQQMLKMAVFSVAKPRANAKSIGRWVLLLIRGLEPHIDLLQGPNMKFLLEFMK